jgi:hypothetical protein
MAELVYQVKPKTVEMEYQVLLEKAELGYLVQRELGYLV